MTDGADVAGNLYLKQPGVYGGTATLLANGGTIQGNLLSMDAGGQARQANVSLTGSTSILGDAWIWADGLDVFLGGDINIFGRLNIVPDRQHGEVANVTVTGGTYHQRANFGDVDSLLITDGVFHGQTNMRPLGSSPNASATISGGTFNSLVFLEFGILNVLGGTFNDRLIIEDGSANITGGAFNSDLVSDNSFSSNLLIAGGKFAYGTTWFLEGDDVFSVYGKNLSLNGNLLTGVLADGNRIHTNISGSTVGLRLNYASVPEPSGWLLFGSGLLAVWSVRRREWRESRAA